MELDMTSGKPLNTLLKFSLPLLAGSVIQNLYNIFDTAIVGHVLGKYALAAVGNSYVPTLIITVSPALSVKPCSGSGNLIRLSGREIGKGHAQLRQKLHELFLRHPAIKIIQHPNKRIPDKHQVSGCKKQSLEIGRAHV